MTELTDTEKRILQFEASRQHWRFGGSKAALIRESFDWSETRYYQVLGSVLQNPAALAFDPMLVRRLIRLRDQRRRARQAS